MSPLLQAEQAVLGGILIDPGQLDRLSWLTPDDFFRPVHQALFAAMRKLQADQHPAFAADGQEVPLTWVTDTVAEAGRNVRGLTASYAHTLVAACPRPGNTPVYGRMVLEGAIHRAVTQHAIRLHQAARADALQDGIEGALHQADILADVLADLARRWGTEPRPTAPATTLPPAGTHQPIGADQAADEEFLLCVLVNQPGAVDEVVDWLRPADFADHGHGHLYRCLGALHHRGEPIDQLTALWEAQRRRLLTDGTLTVDRLRQICGGLGAGSAEYLGERVIRSSIIRAAATSARTIRELASDEALAPGRLINHALHALGPLDEVRTRWQRATASQAKTPPPNPPTRTKRADAALARSQPRLPTPLAPALPDSTWTPAARPPLRSHS
ncbi:DnaB-like helicase N-terminal domain-containing protein [Kitasatospora sp. NPDC056138]|uniref:DnaB-like helicase N-terminal domain-containing protein n=1 Tax=Kitasatospora sp. NPDC056138 TaxID=3345724 RepID=UPI0035D586A4